MPRAPTPAQRATLDRLSTEGPHGRAPTGVEHHQSGDQVLLTRNVQVVSLGSADGPVAFGWRTEMYRIHPDGRAEPV